MKRHRAAFRLALPLVLAICVGCGGASASRSASELLNPWLPPSSARWLVGPVARLATPEEVAAYLELRDAAAAEEFVEAFWRRRDPRPGELGNPVRELFERRAAEADRRFSEAGYLGRNTDRGTIWVLFGEPQEIAFESGHRPEAPPVEVWHYPAAAPAGLAGEAPQRSYRFVKIDDLTVSTNRRPGERPTPSPRPSGRSSGGGAEWPQHER